MLMTIFHAGVMPIIISRPRGKRLDYFSKNVRKYYTEEKEKWKKCFMKPKLEPLEE